MNKSLLVVGGVVLLGIGLAGCGSSRSGVMGGGGDVGGTPAKPLAFEDQFGANGFAPAYRAQPNSEPRDVAAGDVIPVNATAEPVPLP